LKPPMHRPSQGCVAGAVFGFQSRSFLKATMRRTATLAACLLAGLMGACSRSESQAAKVSDGGAPATYLSHAESKTSDSWNPKAAASYLDQREAWWMQWKGAARDHQTFCVSCHTAVPYALARPALHKVLSEEAPSVNERRLLENVTKRVRLWKEVGPFYTDEDYGVHKAAESRGTEAVLNTLILASYDAQSGQLSDDTRAAFNNMWVLQQTTGEKRGAWPWLRFHLEPWEGLDSEYYGAALAAVAVGTAPGDYGSAPEIQNNLKLLREYLEHDYNQQSLVNRVYLLWASTKLPGLLDAEQQKAIVAEVLTKQRADGGWSLPTIARRWRGWGPRALAQLWLRSDWTLYDGQSDGYATGLVTFVLQRSGLPRENVSLQHGLSWLLLNQSPTEGLWPAYSLNERRNPASEIGRFMSDAATAYAVLALSETSGAEQRAAALPTNR
jgi:squalene-hopene/tetraprenyl-beta-curcumene cyclase